MELGGECGGECEGKTRTKRRERNGSEVNCGTGVFVKILSKESRKGPTYKKGGRLFSTHTQTNDKIQKPQRGGRGGGRRIKRSGREKEMTVRAGRGWAKEASTERDDPSRPHAAEIVFFSSSTEFTERTGAMLNPRNIRSLYSRHGPPTYALRPCLVSTRPSTATGRRRASCGV